MKKLMTIAALAAICAGCHSPKKVRDIELKGMYVNGYSEVVAIGHTDRTAECAITQGVNKIRLQVRLAKDSPAAQMQLEFRDAAGRTVGDERWTVKKSRKATLKVPQGAVKALLSAGRATGSDPATFEVFTIMAIP